MSHDVARRERAEAHESTTYRSLAPNALRQDIRVLATLPGMARTRSVHIEVLHLTPLSVVETRCELDGSDHFVERRGDTIVWTLASGRIRMPQRVALALHAELGAILGRRRPGQRPASARRLRSARANAKRGDITSTSVRAAGRPSRAQD